MGWGGVRGPANSFFFFLGGGGGGGFFGDWGFGRGGGGGWEVGGIFKQKLLEMDGSTVVTKGI